LGAGIDILRSLRIAPAPLLLVFASQGCLDFVEPDIPEMGAPATLQATVRLTDLGTAEIDAQLMPGLDGSGARRQLTGTPLEVLGQAIDADTIRRNGVRRYLESWIAPDSVVGQRITLRAPGVEGVLAAPPSIQWLGIRKLGSDTLDLAAAQDLRLPVDLGNGVSSPQPEITQWFLRLAGDSAAFGISADGMPPDTIVVPAHWLPRGEELDVRLIYNQSSILRSPPGDYVGVITLDVRLFWIVHIRNAPSPEMR
jgi:hypothetical protein